MTGYFSPGYSLLTGRRRRKGPFFFPLFLLLLNKKKGGKCRHWVQLQRHIMAVETIYTVLEAK